MTPVEYAAPRRTAAPGTTLHRILEAAFVELAEHGEVGLSLRSVARAVGVSVQSLYHYFDSRAALVDALVRESGAALACAVDGAADARTAGELLSVAGAFLRWAGDHPSAFTLLHGRGLPVGVCGCTSTAARLRGALLGAPGGPGAEARIAFWAVVYATAASGCGHSRAAWEPMIADAAARAERAGG